MHDSELLQETLGSHVFDNFLHVKTDEWDAYRTQVTPWEIKKYMRII